MELGADDYITKPFDDVELLNAVESRLRKNQLLKSKFDMNLKFSLVLTIFLLILGMIISSLSMTLT
jgi:DNA-binding response OmpR family regulator